MRILHLSKNESQGGAARAAYRLHDGLRRNGHDSRMLVLSRSNDDPAVIAVSRPMDLASRLQRGLRQYRIAQDFRQYHHSRPAHCELFTDDRTEYTAALLKQIPASDVLNLHWVSGFVDYESFFRLAPSTWPIVWTLHDMNPFTGGCHYNLGCDHYLTRCSACPQLGSTRKHDLSSTIWQRKGMALSRVEPSRLHIVAPSRWLALEAQNSTLFRRFSVSVIPYGLDVDDTFVPRDQAPMRDLLGIPRTAQVVLFLAEKTNSPRKGIELLTRALARSAQAVPDLFLLSVGSSPPRIDAPIPSLHLGSVDNDRLISMAYNAADLFVISSVQDNLPNTVLEAMACGLPVVGVEVGGIPDMVRTEVNGLTVLPGDADSLASAIGRVLNDRTLRKQMGEASRSIAVNEYSLALQANRYAKLYQDLILSLGTSETFRRTDENYASRA